jgi:hypothetical protein
MAIQIMPSEIDGFDGLDNMFQLKAADDEGNIGLDILTTVTADEWPEISDAILRGLMLMCPGSGVRFGQASIDDLTRKINEGLAPSNFGLLLMVGDTIYEKVLGDRWPGTVVAVFNTLCGETRIVVECTAPDVKGDLHIYNPDQLTLIARKK